MLQPSEEKNTTGSTSKLKAYPYLLISLGPVLAISGILLGGWYNFMTAAVAFIFIPIMEFFAGIDGYNPTKEESKELERRLDFRAITWAWVPVQFFLILFGSAFIGRYWDSLTWIEVVGVVLSIGLNSGGVGITVAHELIHKQNTTEPFLGKLLLMSSCYLHFFIEHLQGHHKRVATEEDPATSRLGESLYSFLPRSIIGSFLSAWDIEMKRLRKQSLPLFSPFHNQMLQFLLYEALFLSSSLASVGQLLPSSSFSLQFLSFCWKLWITWSTMVFRGNLLLRRREHNMSRCLLYTRGMPTSG